MAHERILNSILVYGTNPANNANFPTTPFWKKDEIERAQVTVRHINTTPLTVICIGGEKYVHSTYGEITEAASMRNAIFDVAQSKKRPLSNVKILLESEGLETLEQTDQAINILRDEKLMHGVIGIVTSWHQMPRISLILWARARIRPETYIANYPHLNRRLINEINNCITGLGYTGLVLLFQSFGFMKDGGPVIKKFRDTRKTLSS